MIAPSSLTFKPLSHFKTSAKSKCQIETNEQKEKYFQKHFTGESFSIKMTTSLGYWRGRQYLAHPEITQKQRRDRCK
jgi:hypothetical protein